MARQVSLGAFQFTSNGARIPPEPTQSPPRSPARDEVEEDSISHEEDTEALPKDRINVALELPALGNGVRVLVTCSPLALVGHGAYDIVLYDPAKCKPALRPIMHHIMSLAPHEIEEDTSHYIVRGPKAVGSAAQVDKRIRKHTRRSLGLVMIPGEPVVLWCVEDNSGHSRDYDED